MSNFKLLFVTLFLLINSGIIAQTKWYQQKNSTIPTAVNIDGIVSFPRNESGGIFIDFDNDGLQDFIIPTYFSSVGNYDVQFIRFLKNIGNGQFKEVTDQYKNPDNIKFGKFLVGMNDRRGVVLDYNKDGKMDFLFPAAWENADYSKYETNFGFTKMKDFYYKTSPSNYIEYRAGGGYQAPSFFYQANGTFQKGYTLFDTKTFTVDSDVETEDINNDGWPDMIINQVGYKMNADLTVADWLRGITIWTNNTGNGFRFSHIKLVDTVNKYTFGFQDEGKIGIADMDGDNFKDLIIYGIKTPYKARKDISTAKQDSVLWDANYITTDETRSISYETRIYFNNKGVFDEANYIIINGLRATFPMGVDLNEDGKNDILAVWKNYRAGGATGVYTDSLTNTNGINNQYYVYINKGSNKFEDQTSTFFPNDNYKFSRLGRGDFYYLDIDGDGKNDFIPISMGDDTLGSKYGSFGIDPATSNATVYYKNEKNSSFKKISIDTLVSNNNPLGREYFLNNIYINDLNKDGVNDLIGFSKWNLAPIVRCQTPILSSYIEAVCGSDGLSTRIIKVKNFNAGDSIFWNYSGNISKTKIDSFNVKELGWVVAIKKDTTGCISFNSDTLFIKKSPNPVPPRIYSNNNTVSDANNICIGDKINLASDPGNTQINGIILWFDGSKQLTPINIGGVTTLIENGNSRNIATTTKIQIDSARNVYTRFLSDDGCYSDTSNFFKIVFKIPNPIVRDTAYCINTNADTLKAISLSGHSLNWYGNNATSGTGSSLGNKPNTSIIGNFNYYVSQINNATGCEGPRARIGTTINPLPKTPNVTDTSYCNKASSDTLRVNPAAGNNLLWYGTNAIGGSSSNTAIKPSTDNTGTISYYVSQINSSTGCESLRAKINITIKPNPPAPLLSRDTANNLVANTNGITWFKDGLVISDTTQKFKPSTPGSYTVKTTQNGCVSPMSSPYYYLVTDIINLSNDEFIKLAPNPFINQINLDFRVKGYQKLNVDVFEITTGNRVFSRQGLNAGIPISLSELSPGTYIIKITSNDSKIVQKFKMLKM